MTEPSARRVELNVSLNPRQAEAFRALRLPATETQWLANNADPQVIEVLFGGSKGPGKSFSLCLTAYYYALQTIQFFDLPVAEDVPHIGWMGRKVAQVFTGTTLDTWKTIIPSECYTIVSGSEKHPRHIRIADRVAIDYGGLDSRQDLERFNSAEYGSILLDQAEETTRDDVATLRASRRKRLHHKRLNKLISLPYRGLFTANPRPGWLKEDFIDCPKANHFFVPALPTDNPRLPAGYIQTLEAAFGHRPDLIKAYRDGDWSALSGVDQIILQEWLTAARMRVRRWPYIKRWVSVDPARFGDDSCVILGGQNTEICRGVVLPYCSEPQIVSETESMLEAMGDQPGTDRRVTAIVEVVGVCGVGDYLLQHGRDVIQYGPAQASSDPEKYVNVRAEVWTRVAKWFSQGFFDPTGGMVALPEPTDDDLWPIWQKIVEQMCWPWYEFRGQKVLVAAKEDIKKDHGGISPDYADAYVNGVAHLPRLPVYQVGAGYRARPDSYNYDRLPERPKSAWTC